LCGTEDTTGARGLGTLATIQPLFVMVVTALSVATSVIEADEPIEPEV
jgi:hypothetical protein